MDCSMQASLSFTISLSLLKFMSIESANYLILCHSLLPSIFPSMRVFSNESTLCVTWPKYWSFSFSISTSPSNEYSGLISFRVDWFDLLVKGPSTSPAPQIESINSSVLSLPYGPALTSTHDYWKNPHSFDYTDFCWQSDISAF